MKQHVFQSTVLGNQRSVWFQPSSPKPRVLFVLLDAEHHLNDLHTPAIVEALQEEVAFSVLYVSHIDYDHRWPESFCNAAFATSLVDELLPWARATFAGITPETPIVLGGLSLTGLAATHAAMSAPEAFLGVMTQSASYWWNACWIVEWARKQQFTSLRFRITCGQEETEERVDHGKGLIQTVSQLAACRAVRDVLLEAGCDVSYEEFAGDHGLSSFVADLPNSMRSCLRWL